MKYLFIEGSLKKKGWSYIKKYFLFQFDSASYVIEFQHNNIVFNLLISCYIFLDTNYRVKLNKYIYISFFKTVLRVMLRCQSDLLVIDFSNVVSCLFFIICHYFRYLKYIYLNSLLLFYFIFIKAKFDLSNKCFINKLKNFNESIYNEYIYLLSINWMLC